MEPKDWISFFIGVLLFVFGALHLYSTWGSGFSWFSPEKFAFLSILPYIAAAGGFYLMVNSVIEITNSNAIGWFSFLVAVLFLAAGVLQTLYNQFSIGPSFFALSFIKGFVYYIIFTIEGIFLMIACFAMEM